MMLLALFGILFAMLFTTVPIASALGISASIIFKWFFPTQALDSVIAQSMITSLDSFSLLAIPLFILVGSLMEVTGIADKLVNLANAIAGNSPGGLGNGAVLACMMFAAISGSAPATVAAIGGIMIPAMIAQNYRNSYAGALIASASTVGPIIPPSIPMIMYAVTVGCSTTKLFTGGIIPGVLMGVICIAYNIFIARKNGWRGKKQDLGTGEFFRIVADGIWAILMPVVILGGIYSGIFTPTEAAAVGIVYALIVGKFIYRELTMERIKKALIDAAITSGTVVFLFGGAGAFSKLLTIGKVTQIVSDLMAGFMEYPWIILLIINIILLIAGMFIDAISSILLFAPLFAPIMVQLGYDPVYLGVLMTVNLMIGGITPPLGGNLFIAMKIANCTFEEVVKEAIPFMLLFVAFLVLLSACPAIIMFMVR